MKRSMTFVFTPFSHNLKMYVENSNRDKPCLTFTGLRSPVKYLFILYYIQYILKWFSTTKNFFYLLPFSKASALAYMNPESKLLAKRHFAANKLFYSLWKIIKKHLTKFWYA